MSRRSGSVGPRLGAVGYVRVSREEQVRKGVSLDPSSPAGRFVLTLLGALAEMERGLISERTRGALAWKRDQGLPTSHAPLGFRSRGKRQRMEPVPAELETVRRILTLSREDESYHTIADRLNIAGVRTKRGGRWWYPSTVRNIVRQRERYSAVLGAS